MLSLLPPELFYHISSFLTSPDIAALSAASRAALSVAQRCLYRHIALSTFQRNLACVFTLANSPHLAAYVRSFAVRTNPYDGHLYPFYRSLARALANMSDLSSLEVFTDQPASWILKNTTVYPRLQYFASSFYLDPHLVHFLNKTPSISQLKIDSIPVSVSSMLHLNPDALPRLAQFTGSALVAQLIVPTRPVQHIDLNSGDLTEDVATNLAQSSAPILALGANTSSHSLSLIATLTSCMEHLQHLRIVTTFANFTDLPDTTYFDNITDALTSLPDLKSCEIWGFHWISSKKSFHDDSKVWHSPSFNTNNLMSDDDNFLDNIYADWILPY